MEKTSIFIAFFTLSLWLSIPCFSEDYSDKPIIDEQFKIIDLEMKGKYESCRNTTNFQKIMDCKEKIITKYRNEGLIRGTEEYCRKNYSNLPREQMHILWQKLQQNRRSARIVLDGNKIVPGEVTESMFKIEEMWVEDRLARMRESNIKALGKKLFGN